MADDDWTPDFGNLDVAAPPWAPKRPVRIAVLGDFSAGAAAGRLETGDDLARRKMIPVEFDNLEDTLARLEVKLALPIGEGGDGVEVEFGELDSFHPDSLYRELPMFKALAELRKRLNNTATFAKAAAEVQAMAGGPMRRASRSGARRSRSGAPAANAKLSRLRPAGRHRARGQRRCAGRRADEAHHGAVRVKARRSEARCAGRRRSTARSRTRCARCCTRASSRTSRRSGAAWT